MSSPLLRLPLFLVLCGIVACQSPHHTTPPAPRGNSTPPHRKVDLATRNNAFALLRDLLNDEKNLSKVLLIKFESPDVDRLVTKISRTADDGAKLLETVSKSDSALAAAKLDLPPGEAATREAIAQFKKHQLLQTKRKEFEFELLLTQVQALNYGAQLASVLASNEPQPERAREFSNLSVQLKRLYGEVTALVRTK